MWPSDSRESFYLTTLQEHLYTFGVEVKFTRNGDFTWRVSDCEELVGVTLRRWCGARAVNKKTLKAHPKLSQHDRRVSVPLKSNYFQEQDAWLIKWGYYKPSIKLNYSDPNKLIVSLRIFFLFIKIWDATHCCNPVAE